MLCNQLVPLLGQESRGPSEKVRDFKSFQQTVSSVMVRGQPSAQASLLFPHLPCWGVCCVRGVWEGEQQEAFTDIHHQVTLPKGWKTLWERCSARHTSLGPGETWQRLLLRGTEGHLPTEFSIWYMWAAHPLPSCCDSKAFKLCSFLMQFFRLNMPVLSIPPSPSLFHHTWTSSQSLLQMPQSHTRAASPCSPWLALMFSDSSRHLFLLLGAESRGWFLHIAKGILCALADSQYRS